MNEDYLIEDKRYICSFKTKTFSGFKKTDVINTVIKSIESRKIEQACHWTTECIISGYSLILWEKLMIYSSKVINVNNPTLPSYFLNKSKILQNQIDRLDMKSKETVLLLRNSQMIRNMFFDIITTLITSPKSKKYDKYPKINELEDFKYENIQKRLFAQMNILPNHIIKFNDPDELKIIINEIFALSKNKQFGYEKCCYWIMWLIKWETLHKKKKTPWNIHERDVKDVDKKYRANIIWVIWDTLFEEMRLRKNKNITKQIKSLFSLYTLNYTVGKRNTRLPILFNAVAYLTNVVKFSIPIRSDHILLIQVQGNVNKMFMAKKVHEEKIVTMDISKVPKNKNKKKSLEKVNVEIIQDKINIFNEVDSLIISKSGSI
jgi:hypothetical protein